MKVLVTGGYGQLGCELNDLSQNQNSTWIFPKSSTFDLLNLKKIESSLDKFRPDVIVNCAAFTDVEKAENNFKNPNILNHLAVKVIAKWCLINKCKLIHISTDYIFDGKNKNPLNENAMTNPLNYYGKSKLLGEIACRNINSNSIILRTSWLYSSYGNNFVKKLINLLNKKKTVKVVDDQIGSPTYAADLAKLILHIINFSIWIPGVYNFTNIGSLSRYDFAKQIKLIYGSNTPIFPISSIDYKSKVQRPKQILLDNDKIKSTFNVTLNNYRDSLGKCIKILKNES